MEVGLLRVSVTTHRAWYVNRPCINAMDSLDLKNLPSNALGSSPATLPARQKYQKAPEPGRDIYNPSLYVFVSTNASEDIPAAITERQSRGRRIQTVMARKLTRLLLGE